MKNLGEMMKQAQKLQERMAAMQTQLQGLEIDGVAGGGMVRVTLNGRSEVKGVKIDPELFTGDDVGIVEDLIVAAFGDARAKVEEATQERMRELTGGLPLPPGMTLPF